MLRPWNRGQSTTANVAGGSDAHSHGHTVRSRRHSGRRRRPSSTHHPLPDCCPEIAPGRLQGEETRLRAPRPSKISSSMISCSVAGFRCDAGTAGPGKAMTAPPLAAEGCHQKIWSAGPSRFVKNAADKEILPKAPASFAFCSLPVLARSCATILFAPSFGPQQEMAIRSGKRRQGAKKSRKGEIPHCRRGIARSDGDSRCSVITSSTSSKLRWCCWR
jgi:hypothetical protein